MERTERAILIASGLLMSVFFAALVYSASRLNIAVPTCVTSVAPFKQGRVIDKGNHHYEVHMVAKMWAFDPPEVRLPPGSEVDLYLSALDVTHGLYIEHTNVNLMAIPGAVNRAQVRFDTEGEYSVICHEYCGTGHQLMMGKFVIARGAVVAPVPPQPAAGGAPASLGKQLFEQKNCGACHSIDGSPGIGPTMKGIYGHVDELEDGSQHTVDDAYLEEALRNPGEMVPKGYQPIMPVVPLTEDEIRALVDYVKSLS
jgi:cytochrome c oxidase subunit 2